MAWYWILLILLILLAIIAVIVFYCKKKLGDRSQNGYSQSSFGRKTSHFKICVVSRNGTFASAISDYVNSYILAPSYQSDIRACSKVISTNVKQRSSEDFEGADLVMLVAIAEPRMLFVSESVESQLGKVYDRTRLLNKSIFMVIAGHADSDEISDDEAYNQKSLANAIKAQPALGQLSQNHRLVSVGYTHNPSLVCFNSKQIEKIKVWINQGL